eukprot:TRINITY_DN77406_c0_g1_i1.p1 TRINITY_DN77406_c0_g1~~TRINITY_DN77406_c0_g1_i1.p1  ORF type:complete len:209 (-),score=11.88 TRINITY_DN77406_c0_g1_i1:371-919(-)
MCRDMNTQHVYQHTPYGWPAGSVAPNGALAHEVNEHEWSVNNTPVRPRSTSAVSDSWIPNNKKHFNKSKSRHNGHSRSNSYSFPCGTNRQPVCLDWLQGECTNKRWKCKFAHPPLDLIPKTNNFVGGKICPVWALTGHCAFGDECRRGRHPESAKKSVCAPVPDDKVLYGIKNNDDLTGLDR